MCTIESLDSSTGTREGIERGERAMHTFFVTFPCLPLEDFCKCLLFSHNVALLDVPEGWRISPAAQVHLQFAVVGSSNEHEAGMGRKIACAVVALAFPRDCEVCGVHVQEVYRVCSARLSHHPSSTGPLAVASNKEIEAIRFPIRESNMDGMVITLLQAFDKCAEHVFDTMLGSIVHQSYKITAHNLEVGREALQPFGTFVCRKESSPFTGLVYELQALFFDRLCAKVRFQSHLFHDLYSVSP